MDNPFSDLISELLAANGGSPDLDHLVFRKRSEMEFPYKARILDVPRYTWEWLRNFRSIKLNAGDEITVVSHDGEDGVDGVYAKFIDPTDPTETLRIRRAHIIPVTPTQDDVSQPHKCHCPKENFQWNGYGCMCGGE